MDTTITNQMPGGRLWELMNAQPRRSAGKLRVTEIPDQPGVYVLYYQGRPVYVGKGKRLIRRLAPHVSNGASLKSSALRRNVAEHLGISHPGLIKSGAYMPSEVDLARVRAFIEQSEFAWVTCNSPGEALMFESAIKREWMPPLTKI